MTCAILSTSKFLKSLQGSRPEHPPGGRKARLGFADFSHASLVEVTPVSALLSSHNDVHHIAPLLVLIHQGLEMNCSQLHLEVFDV